MLDATGAQADTGFEWLGSTADAFMNIAQTRDLDDTNAQPEGSQPNPVDLSFQHHRRATIELDLVPDNHYLIVCFGNVTLDADNEVLGYGEAVLIDAPNHRTPFTISGCFSVLTLNNLEYSTLFECGESTTQSEANYSRIKFTSWLLPELCEMLIRMQTKGHNVAQMKRLMGALSMVSFAEAERQCKAREVQPCRSLPKSKLSKVMDYVRSNIGKNISTEMLAECCGYSQYHFSRLFKSSCGLSPKQFVINERVKFACELMRNTETALAIIAYDSGFSSQSHMTSTIKNVMGKTPSMIRQEGTEVEMSKAFALAA